MSTLPCPNRRFNGYRPLNGRHLREIAARRLHHGRHRFIKAPSHMDPAETVQAFAELKAKRLMIAHWGTFRLGDEPVHRPPRDLKNRLDRKGLLSQWVDIGLGQTHYF